MTLCNFETIHKLIRFRLKLTLVIAVSVWLTIWNFYFRITKLLRFSPKEWICPRKTIVSFEMEYIACLEYRLSQRALKICYFNGKMKLIFFIFCAINNIIISFQKSDCKHCYLLRSLPPKHCHCRGPGIRQRLLRNAWFWPIQNLPLASA